MESCMGQTIVKICGITNLEDAQACLAAGADWLGFNCYPPSPRFCPPEVIRQILQELQTPVVSVGVFVNEELDSLHRIMSQTGMQKAQLHGDETVAYAQQLECDWFKAFRVKNQISREQVAHFQRDLFLLDAYNKKVYGGSGETFDWQLALNLTQQGRLLLAGGLTPENVGEAVGLVKPYGVDVAGGVEKAPGVKDSEKIRRFVAAVKQASV